MINIICVGKIKEKYFKDAITEYVKRIGKYSKISIIEVQDYDYDKEKTLKLEAINIKKYINPRDYIITLEIEGKLNDSVSLSIELEKIYINNSNITFIIGGSYGLDDSIKEISNYRLSLSKLTFPHQLFRVILLEQIYRSFKILNNETYHK